MTVFHYLRMPDGRVIPVTPHRDYMAELFDTPPADPSPLSYPDAIETTGRADRDGHEPTLTIFDEIHPWPERYRSEPFIDETGCMAIGVTGIHSAEWHDDGQCRWCGATNPAGAEPTGPTSAEGFAAWRAPFDEEVATRIGRIGPAWEQAMRAAREVTDADFHEPDGEPPWPISDTAPPSS